MDLKVRKTEHDAGKVESTRHRRPLALLCYEAYPTKAEAQAREKYLKTSDGRKELKIRLKVTLQKYVGHGAFVPQVHPHARRMPGK